MFSLLFDINTCNVAACESAWAGFEVIGFAKGASLYCGRYIGCSRLPVLPINKMYLLNFAYNTGTLK